MPPIVAKICAFTRSHRAPLFLAAVALAAMATSARMASAGGLTDVDPWPWAEAVVEEFTGEATIEGRLFFHAPAFADQRRHSASIVIEPEYYVEWDDYTSLTVKPFARLDSSDPNRSHVDMRELYLRVVGDDWELGTGIGKVFWGVTESVHLIDIINQTDAIESIDLEEKLGQPMIDLTLIRDWGYLDLFYLPYSRDRTFQSRKGRLRNALVVDTDQTSFSEGAKRWYPTMAARYSNSFGDWDVGVAAFHGTGREPSLSLGLDSAGRLALLPEYERINQASTDIQLTTGAWLWKLESYFRQGQKNARGAEQNYAALAGGFEYTLYGVLESPADIGLLLEYLRDSRLNKSTLAFQNDLFIGMRLALNDAPDTQILAGIIQDLQKSTRLYSIEASRRLGENLKLSLEARFFTATESSDLLASLRDDDFVQLELGYYF